jgi:Na+-translocating ferredoxin:NAD+ oxidoreductase subunit C
MSGLFFLRKHLWPRLMRWTAQPGWQHKIHALDGGLDVPDNKLVSLQQTPVKMPCSQLPLPAELVIAMQQHQGAASRPLVQVGDYVFKNQRIAEAVGGRGIHHHAPSSGIVTSVDRKVAVGSPAIGSQRSWQQGRYQQVAAIVIQPDGKHLAEPAIAAETVSWSDLSPQQLLQRVMDAGICGMGGAGFPTANKLSAPSIHTVVINGAECEPWITADEALMQYSAAQIIEGARIITRLTGAVRCLLVIEDNKKAAIDSVKAALAADATAAVQLVLIPSLYPSGSEKQLVRIATGLEIPSGKHPPDVGVLCHSVATAYAVADAVIRKQPLISRITTVTGPGISRPQNINALIGTPISTLLTFAGHNNHTTVLVGGPMMGYPAPSTDVPLAKTFNCLLIDKNPDAEVISSTSHRDCIRCDMCADVCPIKLQPQTLYFMARHQHNEQALEYALFDCIECGACAAVCPSQIPLVSYYREQKAQIREETAAQQQSTHWKQAFEHNRSRLQTLAVEQEQRRLEKLQHKLTALDNGETLSRQPVVNYYDPAAIVKDTVATPAPAPAMIKTPEQIRADIEAAVARTRAKKAALQEAGNKADINRDQSE